MEAKVNSNCIGCGVCAGTCPEVFQMNDSGLAEVVGDVTPELEESVRTAASDCPVSAIELE